jgi:hypothetical protein
LIIGSVILLTTLAIIIIQGFVIIRLTNTISQEKSTPAFLVVTASTQTVLTSTAPPISNSDLVPSFTPVHPRLPTTPTISPDIIRQQLASLDRTTQKYDEMIEHTQAEKASQDECFFSVHGSTAKECWRYLVNTGHILLAKGPILGHDLYIYDLDSDGRPEVLKWDLFGDGQFDVIEYDLDKNGELDYAVADINSDGQFVNDELYQYRDLGGWQSLVPNGPMSFSLEDVEKLQSFLPKCKWLT